MEESGSVLGIDVGWSLLRASSAVCRLDWNERSVSWKIGRFRAQEPERTGVMTKIAGDALISAGAFDGPLQHGLKPIGVYRAAEKVLTAGLQPLIGKPGQSSSPNGKLLNEHASLCAKIVADNCRLTSATQATAIHEKVIVEAFPTSFLGVMIDDPLQVRVGRRKRSDFFYRHLVAGETLQNLIRFCLPGRVIINDLADVTNHDDRAAVVCALTALCVARGDYTAVGDHQGWIILPPCH